MDQAPKMTQRQFVLFSSDEDVVSEGEAGYWSNEEGWVDRDSATLFSEAQMCEGALMVGRAHWLDADASARPRGWRNPNGQRRYITDLGEDLAGRTGVDEAGEVVMVLPRYGVWGADERGRAQVLMTGDDLAAMAFEHGIEPKPISMARIAAAQGFDAGQGGLA
jgi:hypothetical protein